MTGVDPDIFHNVRGTVFIGSFGYRCCHKHNQTLFVYLESTNGAGPKGVAPELSNSGSYRGALAAIVSQITSYMSAQVVWLTENDCRNVIEQTGRLAILADTHSQGELTGTVILLTGSFYCTRTCPTQSGAMDESCVDNTTVPVARFVTLAQMLQSRTPPEDRDVWCGRPIRIQIDTTQSTFLSPTCRVTTSLIENQHAALLPVSYSSSQWDIFTFMEPFSNSLWIALVVSFLVVGCVLPMTLSGCSRSDSSCTLFIRFASPYCLCAYGALH